MALLELQGIGKVYQSGDTEFAALRGVDLNIERGELRQTILEMIAEAAGRDMEEVIINGDTASGDPFLATLDGLLSVRGVVDVHEEGDDEEVI